LKKHIYIEREERNYANSWSVVFRSGDAQGFNRQCLKRRSFADKKYGSKEKSLQAAIEWRNHWAPILNKPLDESIHRKHIAFKTHIANTTGVIGVTEISNKGQPYSFGYRATWRQTIDGKRKHKTKSFFYDVTKDGDEQRALDQACEVRRRMVKEHYVER